MRPCVGIPVVMRLSVLKHSVTVSWKLLVFNVILGLEIETSSLLICFIINLAHTQLKTGVTFTPKF
jgi:hypothetical protein